MSPVTTCPYDNTNGQATQIANAHSPAAVPYKPRAQRQQTMPPKTENGTRA